jgi:hypothetical protein
MKRAAPLATLPLLAGCFGPCPKPSPQDASVYVPLAALAPDLGAQCAQLCEQYTRESRITECDLELVDAGVGQLNCVFVPFVVCGGRRPAELVRAGVRSWEAIGRWLADAAQLEAASVPAFEILAAELDAHEAPASLIARALASADDERRHARVMTSLARAHGARPGPVRVVVREPRELEAIARENAVEGLVREAYGARVAIDPAIAVDEQRHADLAADVHEWIRPRLVYAARRRVDEARDAARAQLVAECAVELPRAVRDALGLPDAGRAVELARLV